MTPFWLSRPRNSSKPLREISIAVIGNLMVLLLVLCAVALLTSGSLGAAAAGLGVGVVLLSALISWGIFELLGSVLRSDAAPALLIGYIVKMMVGAGLLLSLPRPDPWEWGWTLGAAAAGLVLLLGTEVWAVQRLRITYYSPVEPVSSGARGLVAPDDPPLGKDLSDA